MAQTGARGQVTAVAATSTPTGATQLEAIATQPQEAAIAGSQSTTPEAPAANGAAKPARPAGTAPADVLPAGAASLSADPAHRQESAAAPRARTQRRIVPPGASANAPDMPSILSDRPFELPPAEARAAREPFTPPDEDTFETWGWGPFYWTLSPEENVLGMEREFAFGPFWEQRHSATREEWFLRPFWADYYHVHEGRSDGHLLPPLYMQRQTPLSYNWSVLLFIQYDRIGHAEDRPNKTFFVFPFFFWHDNGTHPERSFWGLLPIYGEMHHFFNYRRLFWAPFPLYTRMDAWNGTTRYGVPWPFIQIFTNETKTARGLYVWPLMGHARHDGHFDNQFWLWPLVYRNVDQLGKPVPRVRQGFIPFYATERSEHIEDISILTFWGWRTDAKRKYHEDRYLWPLWVQGRGETHYVNRWAPFYTHSKTPYLEKKWWMWPFVQYREVPEKDVMMRRSQFLYFLYWHETQTSLSNPELPKAEMTFVWPFYAGYDNGAGVTQTQILSLFEAFLPHSRAVRDTYGPLFALYRAEADTNKGLERWSLLWNLVAQQTLTNEETETTTDTFHIWPLYHSTTKSTPQKEESGFSILFGLLGWKETSQSEAAQTGPGQSTTAQHAAAQHMPGAGVSHNAADAAAANTAPAPVAASDTTASRAVQPEAPAAQTTNTLTLFWFDIEL